MDIKILCLLILLNCCSSIFGESDTPIVQLKHGKLAGEILKSRGGRDFFSFTGIPYAQAGRFQAPTKASNWEGVYEATKFGPQCAQKMWITNENVGEEDCLHLQVYTPSLSNNLPVMVYFHGGGFTIGTANVLHPDYFMDEDVVLVLVNYRLGPFGFLSMQDEILPGNNGLKDQNFALKWVKENIVKFGGNLGRVTIFGNSAGGASVSSHTLSPKSTGLFHAAILQSGSALNPWAMSRYPKEVASRFGTNVGCPTETSASLLKCLLEKSTEELLNAVGSLVQWGYDPFTPFGIVIEPDLPGAFIKDDPWDSLRTGNFNKVPIMTGVTENEGILMHSAYVFDYKLVKDMNENWKNILPITLEYDELYTKFTPDQQLEVSKKIRKFYFDDQEVGEQTRQQLTDAYSDRFFNYGVRENALLMAKHVPVYVYQFAHNRGDYSIIKLFNIDKVLGVSHADELSFEFARSFELAPEFQKGCVAEQVSKNFVKLWASFAKNGFPKELWGKQQKWEPVSSDEQLEKIPLRYYRIDSDTSIIDEPFTERMKFWRNILENTNRRHDDEL